MKNIHVLKTDKPSKLYFNHNKEFEKYQFSKEPFINGLTNTTNQHIYITSSDEEIKKGDCVIQINYEKTNINLIKCVTEAQTKIANDKNGSFIKNKIILTTDQDLIKDGVQAIDDEFLEWFVKNPSCEWVDIETMMECEKCGKEHCDNLQCRGYKDILYYKIIIPKEEPKQESLSWDELIREAGSEEQLIKILKLPHIAPLVREAMKMNVKSKIMKNKETLEEVAIQKRNELGLKGTIDGFIAGAKWQQEQMYSEEDVIELLKTFDEKFNSGIVERNKGINNWFEQFKKK